MIELNFDVEVLKVENKSRETSNIDSRGTFELDHNCRVIYQIEIIADTEPSITLRYDRKNRMCSSLIAIAELTWSILTLYRQIRLANTVPK